MSILSKSSVGFRVTLEYLESRGWSKPKASGTIHYKGNKDHFLRYQLKSPNEQEIQFRYYGRDITKIEEIVLLEEMFEAKTQKRRLKLKKRFFGTAPKREQMKTPWH